MADNTVKFKKSSYYSKPAGRTVGKYFKGKTESSNRTMPATGGADNKGRRFKAS